jgi:hypothetical protein
MSYLEFLRSYSKFHKATARDGTVQIVAAESTEEGRQKFHEIVAEAQRRAPAEGYNITVHASSMDPSGRWDLAVITNAKSATAEPTTWVPESQSFNQVSRRPSNTDILGTGGAADPPWPPSRLISQPAPPAAATNLEARVSNATPPGQYEAAIAAGFQSVPLDSISPASFKMERHNPPPERQITLTVDTGSEPDPA